MTTQKQDVNIISILDFVESTKYKDQRLLKKLKRNLSHVFSATNIEICSWRIRIKWRKRQSCLPELEGSVLLDGEAFHVKACKNPRSSRIFDTFATSVNINSDDDDHIVFDICRILNCNFCQLTDNSSTEKVYSVQQATLVKVFNWYKAMELLKSFTEADGRHSVHVVTRYTYKYFGLVT